MSQVSQLIRELGENKDGAALVEYTVLLGIVLVGVILIIIGVGGWINNHWSILNAQLT